MDCDVLRTDEVEGRPVSSQAGWQESRRGELGWEGKGHMNYKELRRNSSSEDKPETDVS